MLIRKEVDENWHKDRNIDNEMINGQDFKKTIKITFEKKHSIKHSVKIMLSKKCCHQYRTCNLIVWDLGDTPVILV